jgi:hypothetical protein
MADLVDRVVVTATRPDTQESGPPLTLDQLGPE